MPTEKKETSKHFLDIPCRLVLKGTFFVCRQTFSCAEYWSFDHAQINHMTQEETQGELPNNRILAYFVRF